MIFMRTPFLGLLLFFVFITGCKTKATDNNEVSQPAPQESITTQPSQQEAKESCFTLSGSEVPQPVPFDNLAIPSVKLGGVKLGRQVLPLLQVNMQQESVQLFDQILYIGFSSKQQRPKLSSSSRCVRESWSLGLQASHAAKLTCGKQSSCHAGRSYHEGVLDPFLPSGGVRISAWGCVTADRVLELDVERYHLFEFEDTCYYCGSPKEVVGTIAPIPQHTKSWTRALMDVEANLIYRCGQAFADFTGKSNRIRNVALLNESPIKSLIAMGENHFVRECSENLDVYLAGVYAAASRKPTAFNLAEGGCQVGDAAEEEKLLEEQIHSVGTAFDPSRSLSYPGSDLDTNAAVVDLVPGKSKQNSEQDFSKPESAPETQNSDVTISEPVVSEAPTSPPEPPLGPIGVELTQAECDERDSWYRKLGIGYGVWDPGRRKCFLYDHGEEPFELEEVNIQQPSMEPPTEVPTKKSEDEVKGNKLGVSGAIGVALLTVGTASLIWGAGEAAITRNRPSDFKGFSGLVKRPAARIVVGASLAVLGTVFTSLGASQGLGLVSSDKYVDILDNREVKQNLTAIAGLQRVKRRVFAGMNASAATP
ncbi:MAG: hypothetical protein OXT67_13150 [Zetaproteobacteria bacterium]|nr:hypothetical protein [Zetaproteobacteria bacterium]